MTDEFIEVSGCDRSRSFEKKLVVDVVGVQTTCQMICGGREGTFLVDAPVETVFVCSSRTQIRSQTVEAMKKNDKTSIASVIHVFQKPRS